MAVSYSYALAPFDWVAASGGQPGYHAPPSGSTCVLDLRSNTQAATQGQSAGYGFFAFTGTPPASAVNLGSGDCREIVADNSIRNRLRSSLGLSGQPAGSTLIECVQDCLGSLSDPTGAGGPKPLMPDANGLLEIHLGGHSRVWSGQLDYADLLSANPKGHANRIRDVIRADLDTAEAIGGAPLLRKALGAVLLKCGYSRDEIKAGAAGKAAEWQRLLSMSVKSKHGANAKPDKPDSQYNEAWPNAAADIEATAQSLSWTTLNTDGFADTIKVASGTARASSAFTNKLGICSSAVSSADHYTEARITGTFGAGSAFVTARNAAAAGTLYSFGWYYGQTRKIQKVVTGTITLLSNTLESATPVNVLCRCNVAGSTITGSYTGASDVTATDTAITGNLRGGIWLYLDAAVETYAQIGAWTINDGLSGGGASGGTMSLLGV